MSHDDTDYSQDRVVKNGEDVFDITFDVEAAVRTSARFTHTLFVQYLNDNGYPGASQALDDLWTPREDQWYRNGKFHERYLHGQELLDARDRGEDV